YRSQVYITSALAAIAFSSIVWMNIINARLFFGIRGTPRLYMGTCLGIVGFLVLFGPELSGVEYSDKVLFGFGIALLGALCASFGNMVMQAAHRDELPVVQTNAWGMLYGAILTTLISIIVGHEFTIDTRLTYILSFVYLTVFASVVAFVTYLTLLGRIGAQRAGYTAVMFPVVALIISTIFEGLELNLYILGGFGLVIAGNVLVLSDREHATTR
ncbi:MAG: EamA family transporter, partial [Pseudomonadota bacterium]